MTPKHAALPARLCRREVAFILAIFLLAFAARLIYLYQISDAPYFTRPAGDSKVFYEHAEEIMTGTLVGDRIHFYSSPLYPYFIALVMWLSGRSFFVLGLVQILIGAFNCVLLYFLTKRISSSNLVPGVVAGVIAALYGILVFFDADMLMIFMTLLWVNLGLILLMEYGHKGITWLTFTAGICFGIAALDRTNILLFTPVACWWLLSGFRFKRAQWQWKSGVYFLCGVTIVVGSMFIRNVVVGKDLVLVSSNAGVNFYIGNNPKAIGVFYLPPESGLSSYDLEGTSGAIAEQAWGGPLKPSQISRFWAERGWSFIVTHPFQALDLLGKKFILMWNAYEVPNNLNYYFVKAEYAPILRVLFVGFWLIAPLGLVSVIWRGVRGFNTDEKLLAAFIITYMCSVLPFFVTERYRLPLVPALIAFASVFIVKFVRSIVQRRLKEILFVSSGLAGAFCLVNWHLIQFDYSRMYAIVGTRYLESSLDSPRTSAEDIRKAIISLKWAVEVAPQDVYAHYQLGRAYATIGCYSAALTELKNVLELDPHHAAARHAREITGAALSERGDRTQWQSLPRTSFEEALMNEANGHFDAAEKSYRGIIAKDPMHFLAYNNLSTILIRQGFYNEAVDVYRRGLRFMPENRILLYNLAGLYRKIGEQTRAETIEKKLRELEQKK